MDAMEDPKRVSKEDLVIKNWKLDSFLESCVWAMEDRERVSKMEDLVIEKWKLDSFLERSSFPWNFLYYPGCAFLGGTAVGGAKGTLEGLRAAEKGETLKLKMNRVLNSGVSAGTKLGRSTGAWGLVYGSVECCVTYLRGGTHDPLNSFVAGFGSAALYKSASPRSALIAGVIGGVTAASAVTGAKLLESTFAQHQVTGPEKHGVIMSSPDSIEEPFPYGIVNTTGATYAMGAVGGSAFHFFKGVRNSPNGSRFVGGTRALLMGAPSVAGQFAAFCCLIDTFECAACYLRQKDDSWNPIIGGAATFGFLDIRLGIVKASLSSLVGGLVSSMIEGAMAMVELKKNQKHHDSMKVGPAATPPLMQDE